VIKPIDEQTVLSSRANASEMGRDSTGVILFSSMGQLLFINQQAQMYFGQLQPMTIQKSGGCLIPPDVHSVVLELLSRLFECDHPKDCEAIEVERLCFNGLLLHGFCIPDHPIASKSRVLVTIHKLQQKIGCPDINIQYRYHLTQREQMVIIYLMLGFTNKEIASRLNLSEYTVKEHLKRIMRKTNTTTRTGLLARMVFPISGDDSRDFSHSGAMKEPIGPAFLEPKMTRAIS
jgi:DNA-binding CsgD family transcriptional regulator